MFLYLGFGGSGFIPNALKEAGVLNLGQSGIWTGLNGMAVGGKRRITIEPKLVYSGLSVTGRRTHEDIGVRQEQLIVEATLTESCIPVILRFFRIGSQYIYSSEKSGAVTPICPSVTPAIPCGASTSACHSDRAVSITVQNGS